MFASGGHVMWRDRLDRLGGGARPRPIGAITVCPSVWAIFGEICGKVCDFILDPPLHLLHTSGMGLGPKEAALKAQREARAGRGGKNPRTAPPSTKGGRPAVSAAIRSVSPGEARLIAARMDRQAGAGAGAGVLASLRPAVAEDRIIFGAPAGLRARLEVVRRSRGDRSLSETIRVLLEAALK